MNVSIAHYARTFFLKTATNIEIQMRFFRKMNICREMKVLSINIYIFLVGGRGNLSRNQTTILMIYS